MHYAALPVPLVLADELDRRPGPQPIDSRSEIEVVRNQHCLPRRQPNNETLVPNALGVVSQHLRDDPTATDFDAALVIAVRRGERAFVALPGRSRIGRSRRIRGLRRIRTGAHSRRRERGSVVEHSVL